MMTFVFDGTFEGLLTAIFEFYERKPGKTELVASQYFQPSLISESIEITSDQEKAKRVWDGLKKKLSADWQNRFYKTFLSELPESFQHLFDFARYIFDSPKGAEVNYGHPSVIAISKMDKSVNRERHRMKAFIRFQETADGIFYASIEPDYNVLPLIAGFFKNRYADQRWIIYDVKRKYGLFYDLDTVSEITMDEQPELKGSSKFLSEDLTSDKDSLYGLMWNDYFRATNIPARKNMKLHIRHVPKRYWKYLTEKQEAERSYFIAVLPPKDLSAEIIGIQKEFAVFASERALKTVPHITLKAPFKIKESHHNDLIGWFKKIKFSTEPFQIDLDGFAAFSNLKHPVIYINVKDSAKLVALQRHLLLSLNNIFPEVDNDTNQDFHPHLTVAFRDLAPEEFQRAWPVFRDRNFCTSFTVDQVHLMQHDGTQWRVAAIQ